MRQAYRKMKNLFLRQSYLDSWEDYERSLHKTNFIRWDYIILTASNEEQAATYREQIEFRLKHQLIPETTHYAVLPDPDGKRIGSGGATFNVMKYISNIEGARPHPFTDRRILVIHSGGDSKRIPQYSASGKLFSPVPRTLPNGRASTLFDEFIIGMSGVPSRIKEGMLVLSGDVLLLFNPLQIDFQFNGAAAISIKEHVDTGKNHGVFLNNGNDCVKRFLHKQSAERLQELGAVNEHDNVDLDTGAVLFDCNLLEALFALISTDGLIDNDKFRELVNESVRISFYGDFLFPLAEEATLEDYYNEAAEGSMNENLLLCRKKIWDALSKFQMKLLCLAPAEFIHFGTTSELRKLVTEDIVDYEFLDWEKLVLTTREETSAYASHNTYIGKQSVIGENAYVEDSYVLDGSVIGADSIVSNMHLRNERIPENVVYHGLRLKDNSHVVRIYGVDDNPKKRCSGTASFLGAELSKFIALNCLDKADIWDSKEDYLWFANLYPVCENQKEAIAFAHIIFRMANGTAGDEEIKLWKRQNRLSLFSSFNWADGMAINLWQRELENRILASKFVWALEAGNYYVDALQIFGARGITEEIYQLLMSDAEKADTLLRTRVYYALSRYMKDKKLIFADNAYDTLESLCFDTIQKMIYDNAVTKLPDNNSYMIDKKQVDVEMPVRVNWGGGWTDTPPYCIENGGVVLNAAIKLNGIKPVQVTVKRLDSLCIEFESTDVGVFGRVHSIEEIQDCHNPYDSFALHKAALIACGIIPLNGGGSLEQILRKLGGGIYLSTQVAGIPKGSGLGTSSILSGACVKALFDFLGSKLSVYEVCDIVLCMEQIMSTGGGWQDQIGGISDGIKFITSKPGIEQQIQIEGVLLSEQTKKELNERFALIYTGQRRLARNLLRDVVGNYIGARPDSLEALKDMQPLAALMKFELERGSIDNFAGLLNRHWELSKQLDNGSTNTCIEQMFMACEDLIDGKFIAGAGGGGFLQVILKKGVTKEELKQRIHGVFQDSGVNVWDCEILF